MTFTPSGSQFAVTSSGAASAPAVAFLDSGQGVIVWTDTPAGEIRGQLIGTGGVPIGGEFAVSQSSTHGPATDPQVVALPGGGMALAWTYDSPGADGNDVYGITLDNTGAPLAGEYLVNTAVPGDQGASSLVALSTGQLYYAWGDTNANIDIFGRAIMPDGPVFLVNDPEHVEEYENAPEIARLSGDRFVVIYQDEDGSELGVAGRIFDKNGHAVSASEFRVNTWGAFYQNDADVAALSGGGFVVTWDDESQTLGDEDGHSIKAQIFDDLGYRVGEEFRVNATVTGSQDIPAIAALSDGGFVVTWEDARSGDADIWGQAFYADGTTHSGEFQVNTGTAGQQTAVDVAADDVGGFIVTWTDEAGGSPGTDIAARIFTAGSDAGEIHGDTGANSLRGTAGADTILGFEGNDILAGFAGGDTLKGGSGNDVLFGGLGDDRLEGGIGSDTADYQDYTVGVTVSLMVEGPQDTGGAGFDTLVDIENLRGSRADDTLTGDNEANTLKGATGDDVLYGLDGDDFLFGDSGNDTLHGGYGHDTLAGGQGIDTFVINNPDGDVIKDWEAGEKIDISGFDFVHFYLTYQYGRTFVTFDYDGDNIADSGSIVIERLGVTAGDFIV